MSITWWKAVGSGLVRVTDSYLVVTSVNQHVALLMYGNLAGCEEGGFLRRVTGCDAAVAFAAHRPLFVSPRYDVLVLAHSASPMPEKRCLNYIDNQCLKKYDTTCRG